MPSGFPSGACCLASCLFSPMRVMGCIRSCICWPRLLLYLLLRLLRLPRFLFSTFHVSIFKSCQKKPFRRLRSEEHTSELQARFEIVFRLLLEEENTSNISDQL